MFGHARPKRFNPTSLCQQFAEIFHDLHMRQRLEGGSFRRAREHGGEIDAGRLRRFGVTEEALWRQYKEAADANALIKAQFIAALEKMTAVPSLFPLGVLFIHLYDEYLWGLAGPQG